MFFFQYPSPNQKIPFTTKISFVVWILAGLVLLSFFAFSFFIIAVLVGVVLFAANLLQKFRGTQPLSGPTQDFPTRTYTTSRTTKDDNVIDI